MNMSNRYQIWPDLGIGVVSSNPSGFGGLFKSNLLFLFNRVTSLPYLERGVLSFQINGFMSEVLLNPVLVGLGLRAGYSLLHYWIAPKQGRFIIYRRHRPIGKLGERCASLPNSTKRLFAKREGPSEHDGYYNLVDRGSGI